MVSEIKLYMVIQGRSERKRAREKIRIIRTINALLLLSSVCTRASGSLNNYAPAHIVQWWHMAVALSYLLTSSI